MSSNEILKSYSINIDFLNYEKKKDVTRNIIYSEGDVNTAFIYATLTMGNEIINLEGFTITVGVKNSNGESFVNLCEILDAEKGLISIPFTSSTLSEVGFNKFEIVLYKDDKKIVSPSFGYRVVESLVDEDSIEDSEESNFLLVLISQVQGVLDDVKVVSDNISSLEQDILSKEEERQLNESIRISNEEERELQELIRQEDFDNKISELDTFIDSTNKKLIKIDNIDNEINQSKVDLKGNMHDTLSERLQADYENKANSDDVYTKLEIDSKIKDITSIDDNIISDKYTWSSEKINNELKNSGTLEEIQEQIEQTLKDSKSYTNEKVANLVGQTPELLDTLEELSNALGNDPNFATTIINEISQKANKDDVYSKEEIDKVVGAASSINDEIITGISTWSSTKINKELNNKISKEDGKGLSSNDYTDEEKNKLASLNNYIHPDNEDTRHVTDEEKNTWNNKAESNHTHTYSELQGLPYIPTKLSDLENDLGFNAGENVVEGHTHTNKDVLDEITQERIDSWDNKSDSSIDDENVSNDTTWSSAKINSKFDSISMSAPKNVVFDKIILEEDWIQDEDEDDNYYVIISHNLLTSRLFVAAIDDTSKEALLVSYKIIDDNNIKVNSPIKSRISISVINGSGQICIDGESDTRKNLAFDKEVSVDDWVMEDELATIVIKHRLFTEKVLVNAISVDTKESLKIGYKIIDDTQVKITVLNPVNACITVLNGEKEFIVKEGTDVDDSVTSRKFTWSSQKIKEEISNIEVRWEDIVGKPLEFNPTEHDHNNLYHQKSELEVIENSFIDTLFAAPTTRINNIKYYTAQEVDEKIDKLIAMIEKLSK